MPDVQHMGFSSRAKCVIISRHSMLCVSRSLRVFCTARNVRPFRGRCQGGQWCRRSGQRWRRSYASVYRDQHRKHVPGQCRRGRPISGDTRMFGGFLGYERVEEIEREYADEASKMTRSCPSLRHCVEHLLRGKQSVHRSVLFNFQDTRVPPLQPHGIQKSLDHAPGRPLLCIYSYD